MIRALAFLAGVGIVAATTHAAVLSGAGWGSPQSIVQASVAAGVVVAASVVGALGKRRWLAAVMVAALIAGEVVMLVSTAERTVAARDAAQAPAAALEAKRTAAAARLTKAENAVAAYATASLAALAEKGCLKQCRTGIEAHAASLAAEVSDARFALAAVPAVASVSPLAERLGITAWALDLIVAACASVGANGLAATLIAFGAHRRREAAPPPAHAASALAETIPEPVEIERVAQPIASVKPEPTPSTQIAVAPDRIVASFLAGRIKPGDDTVSVSELWRLYQRWSLETERPALAKREWVRAMVQIVHKLGLETETVGADIILHGAKLVHNERAAA